MGCSLASPRSAPPDTSLEELVTGWSPGVDVWPRTLTSEQAHVVARHLTGLFDLPWPGEG